MANPTDAFFSLQTGDGEYKSVIAWINFAGTTTGISPETITNYLPGQYSGYTISFNLIKDSYIQAISAPYRAPYVAFGRTAYQPPDPPPPSILVFTSSGVSGDSSQVTLSNIVVTDRTGASISNYKIIIVDAQYTVMNGSDSEFNNLVTDGGDWQVIEMLDPPPSTSIGTPIISGACTKSLTETAYPDASKSYAKAPVASTINPGVIDIVLSTVARAGGSQAIAVGIILYKEPETQVDHTYNFNVCPEESKLYFDLPYSDLCGGYTLQYEGMPPLPTTLANGFYSPIYSYNLNDTSNPLLTGIQMTINNTLTDNTTDTLVFLVSDGSTSFNIQIKVTFSSELCNYLIKKEVTTRIIDSEQVPDHIFGKEDIFTYVLTFWNTTTDPLVGYEVNTGVYGIKLSDTLPKGLVIPSAITCTTNDVPQVINEFSSITQFDGTNYGYLQSLTPEGNRLLEFYFPPTGAETKEVISIPVMKDVSDEIKPNDTIDNTYSITYVAEKSLISDTVQTRYSICDIVVEKTADLNAYPGKDYTYTIKITNVGNLVAKDLNITDTLPSDFIVNDLPSGKDISITDQSGNPVSDFNVQYIQNKLTINDPSGIIHVLNPNDFFIISIRGKFI